MKNWVIGKEPGAGKDWRWEEKGMIEDEMVWWHQWLNGYVFEQAPGVGDGQGSLVCCSPWEHKQLDTTEWLNWFKSKDKTKIWALKKGGYYFLPFWGLSFHLVYSFLCCANDFKFNQVPLVYCCFYFHCSRRWVIEDLALIYVIKWSAYVFL